MRGKNAITILLLFFVSFLAMTKLATDLTTGFLNQTVYLAFSILLAIIVYVALLKNDREAWILAAILFGVNLVNWAYLFPNTRDVVSFIVVALVNMCGFTYALSSIDSYEEHEYKKYKKKEVMDDVREGEVIVEEIKPLMEYEILKSYDAEIKEKKAEMKVREEAKIEPIKKKVVKKKKPSKKASAKKTIKKKLVKKKVVKKKAIKKKTAKKKVRKAKKTSKNK